MLIMTNTYRQKYIPKNQNYYLGNSSQSSLNEIDNNIQQKSRILNNFIFPYYQTDIIFQANKNYYLQFQIKKKNYAQQFSLKLENDNNNQIIENFYVSPINTMENESEFFEIIFMPLFNNATLNWYPDYINSYSYDIIDGKIKFQKMEIFNVKYAQIENTIKASSNENLNQITYISKFGIQAPPLTCFSVDGEFIKVGRTGIYETTNDINVQSISIVLKPNNDCIIDYIETIKEDIITNDGNDIITNNEGSE